MKCKYCDALLEDGVTVCPECGKEIAVEEAAAEEMIWETAVEELVAETDTEEVEVEETSEEAAEDDAEVEDEEDNEEDDDEYDEDDEYDDEAWDEDEESDSKKNKPALWKLLLVGAGILATIILFACLILKDQGIEIHPLRWLGVQETVESDSKYGLKRATYTADEKKIEKQAGTVVATIGDTELTNAELQIYYWSGVYDFLSQYQYYLESLGFDMTKPLDEQTTVDGDTWQMFFLENAFNSWHKLSSLAEEAKVDGHQLSAEAQAELDAIPAEMESVAQSNGFGSAEEMLKKEMGELCTMDAYLKYMETYYLAVDYFNVKYAAMQPTDQQVEEYFTANEAELASSGITKESKLYDVRHILIAVEGGTTDADGVTTYTDAEWETCRKTAQELLDKWAKEDGTEDGFAALAKEKSADGGSSENGGMYEDLTTETSFVQEFKDWYLDVSRKPGDTGLVKTTYGYHIMYFSASENNWFNECYNRLLMDMSDEYVSTTMDKWTVTVIDKKIALGAVTLGAS